MNCVQLIQGLGRLRQVWTPKGVIRSSKITQYNGQRKKWQNWKIGKPNTSIHSWPLLAIYTSAQWPILVSPFTYFLSLIFILIHVVAEINCSIEPQSVNFHVPFWSTWAYPFFNGVCVSSNCFPCIVFCWPMFVIFFLWPLFCLSINLLLLITPFGIFKPVYTSSVLWWRQPLTFPDLLHSGGQNIYKAIIFFT